VLKCTATAQHVGGWKCLQALCTGAAGKAYVISILLRAELDEPIALMVVRHSVLRKVDVHCRQQSDCQAGTTATATHVRRQTHVSMRTNRASLYKQLPHKLLRHLQQAAVNEPRAPFMHAQTHVSPDHRQRFARAYTAQGLPAGPDCRHKLSPLGCGPEHAVQ